MDTLHVDSVIKSFGTKQEIKQMIREQSKFKGFIITDHDYRNILDISTKTILMHDG